MELNLSFKTSFRKKVGSLLMSIIYYSNHQNTARFYTLILGAMIPQNTHFVQVILMHLLENTLGPFL